MRNVSTRIEQSNNFWSRDSLSVQAWGSSSHGIPFLEAK
jgi:hypothetical protein